MRKRKLVFSPQKQMLKIQVPPEQALCLQSAPDPTKRCNWDSFYLKSTRADGIPGRAKTVRTVIMNLKKKNRVLTLRKKQYLVKREVLEGKQTFLYRFLISGFIWECRSPSNILVKKPHTNKYRFVQDLRVITNIGQDIHPTVSNPYTILMAIPGDYKWCSVLKDAFFFCNPLKE